MLSKPFIVECVLECKQFIVVFQNDRKVANHAWPFSAKMIWSTSCTCFSYFVESSFYRKLKVRAALKTLKTSTVYLYINHELSSRSCHVITLSFSTENDRKVANRDVWLSSAEIKWVSCLSLLFKVLFIKTRLKPIHAAFKNSKHQGKRS